METTGSVNGAAQEDTKLRDSAWDHEQKKMMETKIKLAETLESLLNDRRPMTDAEVCVKISHSVLKIVTEYMGSHGDLEYLKTDKFISTLKALAKENL